MSITPAAGNVQLDTLDSPTFINGLNVTWLTGTTLSITSGVAVDSTGASNIILTNSQTLNMANVGLNGIDTGTIAQNTNYYIFAIGNSVNKGSALNNYQYQGTIASLSQTNPALPAGFDMFRLIDVQKTASGSAVFLQNYNFGNGNIRTKYWDSAITVLTAGSATSLTAISLASAAFPGFDNLPVRLSVSHTPASAGGKVFIAPYGSTSTSLPNLSGSVAAVAQNGELNVLAKLNSTVPTILYQNNAGSGASTIAVTAITLAL